MFGFKDEASYICLNLSTYVKSGMPIGRSLDLIKNTVKDKKYKESLKRIERKVFMVVESKGFFFGLERI